MTKCLNCNIEVAEGDFCPICGGLVTTVKKPEVENVTSPTIGGKILGKYMVEQILQTGNINQYLANNGSQKVIIKQEPIVKTNRESQAVSVPASESHLTREIVQVPVSLLKQEFEIIQLLGPEITINALEYATDGGHEYLVLPSFIGKRLSDAIPEEEFTVNMAAQIGLSLCMAIEKLHNLGYVHLDIEPHNVVLNEDKVKILLSSRIKKIGSAGEGPLTTDGYSAPQLYTNNSLTIDGKLDIYSIGAVMYTCLTGKVLPPGRIPADTIESLKEPEIIRILRSALLTSPDVPFVKVTEMKNRLESYLCRSEGELRFDHAVFSDIGLVRDNNEDCGAIIEASEWCESRLQSWSLYLVADGMGGEQAGEVASKMAVTGISSSIWESLKLGYSHDFNEIISKAVNAANKEIYLLARDTPGQSFMGTTVTLGLRIGQKLYVGHVGDSRFYLIRDGKIRQMTDDHSVVAGMVRAGIITREEAKTHPDRNKIFRSLGNAATVVVDTLKEKELVLENGDILVFCTDGLTGKVEDNEILTLACGMPHASSICTQLVQTANSKGGDDNVTVIVVKVCK